MIDKMTDKDWETFFDLIDKIIGQDGTWQDKKDTVKEKAVNNNCGNLEEFVGWFEDEDEEDDDE